MKKFKEKILKLNTLMKRLTGERIFLLVGFIIILSIALKAPTDPDMGWHLTNGQYLLEHNLKVAKVDIFSHTMPEFPMIMHEWVTDFIMYLIYNHLGLFSLSILFALISAAAYIFATFGASAKKEYKIIAALLGIIASIPILGVRPQMINLLALAIIIFLILRFRQNPQSRQIYFIPLIMVIWVNLHGGFAVGLFFVGIFLGIEILKQYFSWLFYSFKKIFIVTVAEKIKQKTLDARAINKLFGIFLLSSAATLINPYGWRVYIEIVTTIFDTYAKQNINEWLPVTLSNPMSHQLIIYIILLVILLLFSYRKVDYTYLAITAIFGYIAFTSWRHIPLFLIVSTPLWVNIVEALAGKELILMLKKKYFLFIMIIAAFLVAKQQIGVAYSMSSSIEKLAAGRYPYGAIKYLKENPIEGKMFNEYNWGGFIIWQYPEKKVFIDGRMPSWKMGDYSVFKEFNVIASLNEGWDKLIEKYDIAFSVVYNDEANKIKYGILKWEKVYSDDLAAVYKRPVQESGL